MREGETLESGPDDVPDSEGVVRAVVVGEDGAKHVRYAARGSRRGFSSDVVVAVGAERTVER